MALGIEDKFIEADERWVGKRKIKVFKNFSECETMSAQSKQRIQVKYSAFKKRCDTTTESRE